jgi:type IV secretory pathway VirB10-like protein
MNDNNQTNAANNKGKNTFSETISVKYSPTSEEHMNFNFTHNKSTITWDEIFDAVNKKLINDRRSKKLKNGSLILFRGLDSRRAAYTDEYTLMSENYFRIEEVSATDTAAPQPTQPTQQQKPQTQPTQPTQQQKPQTQPTQPTQQQKPQTQPTQQQKPQTQPTQPTQPLDAAIDAAAEVADAAIDAAAEVADAATAAAAEVADAATAAAQDAADAVAALSTQVSEMIDALKKQITALTNLVIKIQKKVKA